jgi:RNA polymerase sigma factor (sigma-70 family)
MLRHLRQMLAPPPEQSDGDLVRRFVAERDEAAFASLIDRHGGMVLGVCRRLLGDVQEAEDAFQATFLVLCRKAGRMQQWGSLGNWLYTVASHVALKARTRSARRRARETAMVDVPTPASADPWAELKPVLDLELRNLPERYRAPVILCYLEGKTNEEAARELGCPPGTLKCRLSRARDLLRRRLTRRGLTLGSALVGPALSEHASAAVSAPLAHVTIQSAMLLAAGDVTGAAAISAHATFMAQGVLRAMFYSKIQTAVVLILSVTLIGAGASTLLRGGSEKPGDKAKPAAADVVAAEKPAAKDAKQPPAEQVAVRTALRSKRADEVFFEQNTPLKEALAFLSEKYGVTMTINQDAFEEIGLNNVEEQHVVLPAMKNVRLATVLNRLLPQLKGTTSYTGTYLLRSDHLEVTTTYRQLIEAAGEDARASFGEGLDAGQGIPPADPNENRAPGFSSLVPPELRRKTPIVQPDFTERPLQEVLNELSAESGVDIVLDRRAAEKARIPVSLTLSNALLDTTVTLLTDMAELEWVWIDKVMYVTTPENAKVQREKAKRIYEERKKALEKFQPAAKPTVAGPGA